MGDNLVLVGAGKMGSAMLSGWLDRGLDGAIVYVLDPGPVDDIKALAAKNAIVLNPKPDEMVDVGAVVLAVKPQIMDEALAMHGGLVDHGPVFISIAAGRTIASFEAHLGAGAAIIRTMPNTPAAIGLGISVACANGAVSSAQKTLCTKLLEAVGKVAWVDDEGLIDAVTAVSGSGPAYVFLLAECMARAGVAAGLPADLAELLARETVSGAGALLAQSRETASVLRQNVTSPGGTTAAALEILGSQQGLGSLLERAVLAAAKRSAELSG